jgi:pyrroloquinoline quinone (PQQ) biosynthesis protein C
MINETGEHPYVFSKNGKAVFVKFPKNVSYYLSSVEIADAEKIILKNFSEHKIKLNENKNISLLGEILKTNEEA